METLRDPVPAEDVSVEGEGSLSTVRPAPGTWHDTLRVVTHPTPPRQTAAEAVRHACARSQRPQFVDEVKEALGLAAFHGNRRCIEILLESGLPVDVTSEVGSPRLHALS